MALHRPGPVRVRGARGDLPRTFGYLDSLYRRLVEYLPEAVYCCDTDGRITLYNEAAVRLWGRIPAPEDDRWCGAVRAYTPEGQLLEPGNCPMALTILGGRNSGSVELVMERPDGSRRVVLVHPQLLKSDAGAMLGGVNVIIDITERKHAENLLREADRRKDEFLSMLAHELRNPLAPVRSAAEILRRAELEDPTQRLAVQMIDRQVAQLARLVDDLLDVARMRRGVVSLKKSRVRLSTVISNATDVILPQVQCNRQSLEVDIPDDEIDLFCDQARVAQMIGNLLHNASKYTQEGGRIVLAACLHGASVRIRVADNGIGMEPATLHDVFDMFSRVSASSGRTTEGLGIGLSVVRTMAELHGGSVSATSQGLGQGSEFTLDLPILARTTDEVEASAPLVEQQPKALRIFLVDDNVDSVAAQQILLESEGYVVGCAYDGFAALGQAPGFNADVYIIDIGLPGMDGYELVRTLRRTPQTASATMIAMSGWGAPGDVRRAIEAGFDRHLSKPVAFNDLLDCLASTTRG